MAFRKLTGNIIAERLAQRRHLKGVGEAVMDEDGTRKREHLSLILKTAESGRVDKAVAVALELGTVVVALRMTVLLT